MGSCWSRDSAAVLHCWPWGEFSFYLFILFLPAVTFFAKSVMVLLAMAPIMKALSVWTCLQHWAGDYSNPWGNGPQPEFWLCTFLGSLCFSLILTDFIYLLMVFFLPHFDINLVLFHFTPSNLVPCLQPPSWLMPLSPSPTHIAWTETFSE